MMSIATMHTMESSLDTASDDLPVSVVTETILAAALTADELAQRERLERRVAAGLHGFLDAGLALRDLKNRRLYRDTHATWDDYLRERWTICRQRAHKLIEAAAVAEQMSQIWDISLSRESHAAALAEVPVEDRPAVLKRATKATGGKLTARAITKAAQPAVRDDGDQRQKQPPAESVVGEAVASQCELAADGRHVWDEDADGRFCTVCKADYDPAIDGTIEINLLNADDDVPQQPRWHEAAGEIVAAMQTKPNAENRHRATQLIWRMACVLDDIEAGRLTVDDLLQKEVGR